jgi:MerR HTH family regulatory protein
MQLAPKRPLPPDRIPRSKVAEILQVSQRTIGRWEAKGISPVKPRYVKVNAGQAVACYTPEAVEALQLWLAESLQV